MFIAAAAPAAAAAKSAVIHPFISLSSADRGAVTSDGVKGLKIFCVWFATSTGREGAGVVDERVRSEGAGVMGERTGSKGGRRRGGRAGKE